MIYIFLANGFEETEAIAPIDCLRRAGKQVVTVGVGGKTIVGSHQIPVTADITAGEISLDDTLEMVILPGGMPGTKNLAASEQVRTAVQFAADNGKWLAAICAAPSVLGKMGLLNGKNAVCYPGFEAELNGAKVGTDAVCADGKTVTARGAGCAMAFGLKLVECLCGKEASDAMAEGLIYQK